MGHRVPAAGEPPADQGLQLLDGDRPLVNRLPHGADLPGTNQSFGRGGGMDIGADGSMAADVFDLTGRVVWVTGSSRGIGAGIAIHLARHGATVVVHGRKPGSTDEILGRARRRSGHRGARRRARPRRGGGGGGRDRAAPRPARRRRRQRRRRGLRPARRHRGRPVHPPARPQPGLGVHHPARRPSHARRGRWVGGDDLGDRRHQRDAAASVRTARPRPGSSTSPARWRPSGDPGCGSTPCVPACPHRGLDGRGLPRLGRSSRPAPAAPRRSGASASRRTSPGHATSCCRRRPASSRATTLVVDGGPTEGPTQRILRAIEEP